MNIENLIASLQRHREAIGEEMPQKLDFDELERDLSDSARVLSSLKEKEQLCEKLLADFKSDVQKMAVAVSRAKGDLSSCSLVEKFLSSPDLSFEDLRFLREKVKEEFNQTLPSSPRSRLTVTQPGSGLKTSEFEAGRVW